MKTSLAIILGFLAVITIGVSRTSAYPRETCKTVRVGDLKCALCSTDTWGALSCK